MAPELTGRSMVASGAAKSNPFRRSKAVSQLALVGAVVVSAGILVLAYEEYWIFFEPLGLPSFLNVEYQLESLGYGLLGAGVLLFGAAWTMGRLRRPPVPSSQGVFERYHTSWGVGIGTLGYLMTAIGPFVVVIGDAGQLAGVTVIRWPIYYPVSESITGIGVAVWAVGAYLERVSSSLRAT